MWREWVRRRIKLNQFQLKKKNKKLRIQFFLNRCWKCPVPIYLCFCKAEQLQFRQNHTFLECYIQDSFNCKWISNKIIKRDKCIRGRKKKKKKGNKMPPFPTTSCTTVTEISIDDIAQRAPALSNPSAFWELVWGWSWFWLHSWNKGSKRSDDYLSPFPCGYSPTSGGFWKNKNLQPWKWLFQKTCKVA